MSTQQDIYAAGSENRPPMLNKENYAPWSSRLLRYAKSRPNRKLIHNSIINGPYVRRMIPEPGDPNRKVPMNETFHVQLDDEPTKKELKQIEADDQAIQTILLGLPEDIYAAVDKKIASNLKFLNNLQPEWSRHVTIVHQTKDLHTSYYTQLYDFLKYNQKEVDDLKAKRLAETQDPLALMETSNNPYTFPVLHQDQPSFNQNYMQQPMPNPKDIIDPTTAMNMALALMAKVFKLNYSTTTNNNQRISSNPHNMQIAQSECQESCHSEYNSKPENSECWKSKWANWCSRGVGNFARNYTVRPKRRDAAYLQTQLLIAQKKEAGIQLQAEEFDLMPVASYLDEIEEINANCILMANLQQASTSGTQTDKAPVYDSDGLAEVHNYENCYDNEIFNMFTQEEQYTALLEPIPEPHQVLQNDNNVISEVSSVAQSGGTVEQHPKNVEETRALYDSLYNNLAIEVEKVNTVNRKLSETNAELTTELARYKNQERCFEISQEKYDKLERCYQKSVYQEQCLSKKINALHLSSGKQIMTLNEEISYLKKQLSVKKSTVSSLLEEKKRLKSDFKIRKDELLDKKIQLEKKIKELDNILVKMADESLTKHKALELKIERLLRAVVSQDIMSLVQHNSVNETSNLQSELERTKERFENCIIKKENEYAKLWNDWYKKCEECKFNKISYDKAYNDMQQKIEWLQAWLGDLKGKSKDTSCVSDTLNPLSHKLENENVELEFMVLNYAKENAHLKATYKNLFESIFVSDQKDTACRTSANTKFAKQSILEKPPKVITPGMFRINPLKPSREEKHVPNKVRARIRTNPITVSQPPVITKKVVNSDSNGLSSTGVDNTKTRRPQPRSNTKNDRVPSTSKSSRIKNKEVEVEEHHRKLLLSRNKKHMSSECNNVKLATQNVKSKVICAMCKQCLNSVNHDVCLLNYVNGMTSRGKKQTENVSINEKQKKQQPKVKKTKKVGSIERLALPKPSKTRSFLRWSPTGRLFDLKGKIIASSESESQSNCSKGDNACTSNPVEPTIKRCPNSTFPWQEHLCPSYEQGKSKRASHPPKPVPNSRQRLHLLHMDLCGPMRLASINGKRNQTLVEIARTMLIFSRAPLFLWAEAIATACFTQNHSIIHHRFNKTPYELINGIKPDISFLHVFATLCYPKNDRKDIRKLGAKGDIGFFIGYSVDSCAYRVFNRRTKKIMETMNVSFDELLAMAFEQRSELDLLFEDMYDDYIGGQPSSAPRTVLAAQAHQVRQTPMTSTSIADIVPTPTNSSSQATNFPNTSQDVDGLNSQQQHAQQQGNQAPL
uniref:Integrase, catalytic region, zinc finger, CCHC-type, peptidase aspartic, catalytic n=1 Tax=Tanacetum cinerariifolium TaxID=118510 RepID=A0A699HTG6_TANCI|nr:integrase, catalytic region, zinc finger, CCHC-type, peptidase aspartic, catalytic [Tanacetum cinerariifolium]